MKYFLIVYNRHEGRLLELQEYGGDQHAKCAFELMGIFGKLSVNRAIEAGGSSR
jgi:hypothetical protein